MTTIKKKDYDKLVQAAKYLERAEYLLRQVNESSPVVKYVIDTEDMIKDLKDMGLVLNSRITQFTHK